MGQTFEFETTTALGISGEIKLLVTVDYCAGSFATLEDPGDPEDACIENVLVWDNTKEQYMPYDILSEDCFDDLLTEFWEKKHDGDFSPDYNDRDDNE